MERRTQSPLAGGPRTVEDTDKDGQPRITVWLTALTPLRAKIADRLALTCGAAATSAIPYAVFRIGEPVYWQLDQQQLWLAGGVLAAPPVAYLGMKLGFHRTKLGRLIVICAGLATCALPYGVYRIVQTGQWQFDPQQFWMLGGALAAAPVTYFAVKFGLDRLLKKTVRVVFTPKHFTISGLFGEKRFDRDLPHNFALYAHDKTRREQQVHSNRASKWKRRWWQGPRKQYYGQSGVLSFDFFDQRIDIATVFGEANCRVFLTRLTACSQIMDRYALRGTGQTLSPEGDWPSQSGDLQAI